MRSCDWHSSSTSLTTSTRVTTTLSSARQCAIQRAPALPGRARARSASLHSVSTRPHVGPAWVRTFTLAGSRHRLDTCAIIHVNALSHSVTHSVEYCSRVNSRHVAQCRKAPCQRICIHAHDLETPETTWRLLFSSSLHTIPQQIRMVGRGWRHWRLLIDFLRTTRRLRNHRSRAP